MGITIQQLSVFLENREGRLDEVLSVLAGNDVNIVALSLADTTEYGMLRMNRVGSKQRKSGFKRKRNYGNADRCHCSASSS